MPSIESSAGAASTTSTSSAKDWVRITSNNTIKVSVNGHQYDITLKGSIDPKKTKQIEALFIQSIKEQGRNFHQALEKLSTSKDTAYMQIKDAHKYKFVTDSSQSGKQIVWKFNHFAKEGDDKESSLLIHTHRPPAAASPPIKTAKPVAVEEVAATPEEVAVAQEQVEDQQEQDSPPEVAEKQSLQEAHVEDHDHREVKESKGSKEEAPATGAQEKNTLKEEEEEELPIKEKEEVSVPIAKEEVPIEKNASIKEETPVPPPAAPPITSPAPDKTPIAGAPRSAVKSLQEQLQEKQAQLKPVIPDALPKPAPKPLSGALDAQGLADLAARRAVVEEEGEDAYQKDNDFV